MRKNWGLLSLTTLIRLLTSCSIGNSNMRKMFFARNDKQIANERFEALIDAIQTHNSDAVKAVFSNNVLREVPNISVNGSMDHMLLKNRIEPIFRWVKFF